MAQYIDKSALVAEIHKMMDATMDESNNFISYGEDCVYSRLCELEAFIDSLEVKEVDLEKEYDNLVADNGVLSIAVNYTAGLFIAEHFFELGLKAQKGE